MELAKAVYAAAAILAVAPTAKCHAYYGRISASGILYCMGHCLSAVLVFGFRSLNRRVKENRRSITLIAMAGAFVFVLSSLKIPSVTGSCSPYDRNRSWCNPVWTMCSECTWNHCSDLPGGVARPWRTDNTWSKLFFHGDYRSDPVLADL